MYVRADGVHSKVRLGRAHSCVPVLLGVGLDGTKALMALSEGSRESTQPWVDLLRDCRRRGMRDAELVIRDSVMGLWRALAEVDRSHGFRGAGFTGNVIHGLPKSAQPGAT